MHMQKLPMRLFRVAMILTAVSCVVAVTPLLSQQAADSASVPEASATEVSAPTTSSDALAGPRRAPPRFQQIDPLPRQNDAVLNTSAAAQGGRHTIVISTLVLVLAVVIIVLLVAN